MTVGAQVYSEGKPVTPGVNIKGNWAELSASTPMAGDELVVHLSAGEFRSYLVDIGVGAAPNEVPIVENLLLAARLYQPASYVLPVGVPAGSRLVARAQISAGSGSCYVLAVLRSCGLRGRLGGRVASTLGAVTATSRGTSVDPGGEANVKGVYSELVPATTRQVSELLLAFGHGLNVARIEANWLVDVAVGAEDEEEVVIPDLSVGSSTTSDMVLPLTWGPVRCKIPVGSRISARAQCDAVDAADRLFDITAYGFS